MPFNEATIVKKLKINYINIPINENDFHVGSIKQFNKIVDSPKQYPIYIHCRTGNRAAMMMAFNNITDHQDSISHAVSEAKLYGLTKLKLMELIKQKAT